MNVETFFYLNCAGDPAARGIVFKKFFLNTQHRML